MLPVAVRAWCVCGPGPGSRTQARAAWRSASDSQMTSARLVFLRGRGIVTGTGTRRPIRPGRDHSSKARPRRGPFATCAVDLIVFVATRPSWFQQKVDPQHGRGCRSRGDAEEESELAPRPIGRCSKTRRRSGPAAGRTTRPAQQHRDDIRATPGGARAAGAADLAASGINSDTRPEQLSVERQTPSSPMKPMRSPCREDRGQTGADRGHATPWWRRA